MEVHGPCALLVEDEFLIALETEAVLRDLGCRDIYSAANVREALQEITERPPDFAVVDINLGGEQSWPVLQALAERRIPFAITTGYALSSQVLEPYGSPPHLRKPVMAHALREAVRRLTAAQRGPAGGTGSEDQRSTSG